MLARRSFFRLVPLVALCGLLSCVVEPTTSVGTDAINAPIGDDGLPEVGGLSANTQIKVYTDEERAEHPRVRASFFKVSHSPRPTPTATPVSTQHTVTGFSPSKGKVGDVVTITGTNFSTDKSRNEVRFKAALASVATASATQLQVKVPSGATDGTLSVKIGDLTISSATTFDVEEALSITGFTPASGAASTTVTITGTGFSTDKAKNKIRFGGATAVDSATASATELEVLVPASAASGPISVQVEDEVATSEDDFTVN